ncbi:MAG: YgjP-like metallopeptidase domain-containing protein [Promethearchaeota archaeon]
MIVRNNLKVNDVVFFHSNGKLSKAIVLKKNPKTALIQVNNKRYRVSYSILFKDNEINTPFPYFNRTSYNTNEDLYLLIKELKKEYSYIFNKIFSDEHKSLLDTVRAKWNSRITYRLGGKYCRTNRNGEIRNEILISSSLKNTPKYLIKYLLYHEILHIKYPNHSKEYHYYEKHFDDYKPAQDLFHKILLEVRFFGKERLVRYRNG